MSDTLGDVRDDVLYRLGDVDLVIWSEAEIEAYLKEGYDRIAILTGCFWDMNYLEDVAGTATYTLPTDFYQMERATWSNKRITPLVPSLVERVDGRYETQQGPVDGYFLEKDGLRTLRKWRVPAVNSDSYTITGTWGGLRNPADITGDTVTGTWGIARRIPTMHRMGNGTGWGTPRRPQKELYNTRIEFQRRGRAVSDGEDTFELPDRYVAYVRNFALWKSLEREGDGHDDKLAAHYQARFEAGIARIIRRMKAIVSLRVGRMGGGLTPRHGPPMAQLPWASNTRTVHWRRR